MWLLLFDDVVWEGSITRSPVPASLHSLVLQVKPSLRAPECPLFKPPPYGFDSGGVTGTQESLLDRYVLTIPPVVGSFRRPVGAQSTAWPWHTDPLTIIIC